MYKKYKNMADFSLLSQTVIGAIAGGIYGATYTSLKQTIQDKPVNPKEFRDESIANTGAGAAAGVGGVLLARALVRRR